MRPWVGGLLVSALVSTSFTGSSFAEQGTTASPGDATVDSKVVEARRLFEEGASLADLSRWSEALEKFEASAALRPHATTTYDIGFCERALGHATRAKRSFEQALAQDAAAGGAELTPALRDSIPRLAIEVRARQAIVTVTVPGTTVVITVDALPLEIVSDGPPPRALAGTRKPGPAEAVPATTFLLELDAGTHEIVVSSADGRSKVYPVTWAAGESPSITLELPAPLVARSERTVAVFGARESVITGLAVVGAIGVGVGSAFGLSAIARWKNAKEACPSVSSCPDGRGEELSNGARSAATISTAAFVVAGAALLSAGLTWALTSPTRVQVSGSVEPRGGAAVTIGLVF
jgi:hypothetical protein